jgi:prepilin-type N-terminal cleavage/methylation domain-containing protein
VTDTADGRLTRHPPARGPNEGAAFTLLEMLTVIIIVGLLLSIGTPAVLRMQVIAMRNTSLTTINVIDGGCRLYANDFDDKFPPSHPDGSRKGAQQAFWHLARKYRVSNVGRFFGPYNGCERVNASSDTFYDAFDHPVLYYRWDKDDHGSGAPATPKYHDEDNDEDPTDINKYATTDGSGKILQRDFILCTKGPDGKWPHETGNNARAFSERDDITNLVKEN